MSKFVKITQLVVVILCLSNLIGLLWFLICELKVDLGWDNEAENFIDYF